MDSENMVEHKFKSVRWIDGKQRNVIVDVCGKIINRRPTKEELKDLRGELSKIEISNDRELLLGLLRHFEKIEGRVPEQLDFSNNPKYPSYSTYIRMFGTWNNALKMAGLQVNVFIGLTDEELLDYLIQFYDDTGRPPIQKDFENNSVYPHYGVYIKRFGSWNNALNMAGLQVNVFTNLANEELLEHLVHFYDKERRPPTIKDFTHNRKYPNFQQYIGRFGSWNNALKLVGLDADSMIRKGIIETDNQKARLAELLVLEHFSEKVQDLSGKDWKSPYDGICPKNQIYDVKSSKLHEDRYYQFNLDNAHKDEIELYYLLGFNKDYSKLEHAWRISSLDFADEYYILIGIIDSYTYNIENMKECEITEKFRYIDFGFLNRETKQEGSYDGSYLGAFNL